MNATLFRHHLRMLLRPGRLLGLALLAGVPGLIVLVVGLAQDGAGRDDVAGVVATVGATTFPIAALILAGATLRDEKDDGTLPYLYLSPLRRTRMAATSIAAAACGTALLGAVAAGLVTVAALLVGADATVGLAALPAYLVAAVGYSALFVPIGYLVPRVILVGLAYVVVWEQIAARLVTGVANTSVWRFALSVFGDLAETDGSEVSNALGPVAAGAGGGVAKAAVVLLLGWLCLSWALHTRDAV